MHKNKLNYFQKMSYVIENKYMIKVPLI